MKFKQAVFIVFLVLLIDQVLKVYVKLNFALYDHYEVFGTWFQIYFIENSGMAFGMNFGGKWGKFGLTLFRLIAVIWGFIYIKNTLVKEAYHKGLITCASLILAGALGNLIDSMIYSKIFTVSASVHKAKLVGWGEGYGELFHGNVVDMLYFPLFKFQWPDWVPVVGGQMFEFFKPVFNVADASIFIGVVTILIFQNRFITKAA